MRSRTRHGQRSGGHRSPASSHARLRDGVPYPAAWFCVGFNDPRVDAWHSGKMAARMQAAGMRSVEFHAFTFGVATLYLGEK